MIFVGIDPGGTGAIGFIFPDRGVIVEDCPDTIKEMRDVILEYDTTKMVAVIEKVNPFFKSSAKSAFTFGMNYAAWQMLLTCLEIPYDFVTPRKWQKEVYDSAKKMPDPKKVSFERASRLFPKLEFKTKRGKILDGRSDAMLIAYYCQMTQHKLG